MGNPQRSRTVVFALPAPGLVPQGQPRAIPATPAIPAIPAIPATPAPTGIVMNADDVGRALPVLPARGAVRRTQPKVPTEIVARSDEVVVPVAHPPQNQAQAEPEEKKSLLPEGTPLLSVAGEKLPMSAVGPALEFLEFCTAFYEPLEMKEIEGEWTLHEIVKGCKLNKGGQSPIARVHVRLLSMILNASDERISPRSEGKTSWLTVLKNYLDEIKQPRPKLERKAIYIPSSTAASTVLSNIIVNAITTTFTQQSPSPPDAVASSSNAPPSDAVASSYVPPPVPIFTPFQESVHRYATALEDGANGYLSLAVEEKLQLLNMLCNDALNTTAIRGYIEEVKDEYDAKKKEEKGKKKEEKEKKKINDGEPKANTTGPSTKDTRTTYVLTRSTGKLASPNLRETSESSYSFHNVTFRSDAVMTEAIVCENGSRAFWKLKGGDDRKAVICRVISDIEGTPKEEWTVYSEQNEAYLALYRDVKKYT